MSQCVPSWGLDDNPTSSARLNFRSHSNSIAPDVPMLDYEVAELTWENGHLAMHGLGQPRAAIRQLPTSTLTKYAWPEKPRAGGTLESIVNQATRFPIPAKHSAFDGGGGGEGDELVPWFNHHQRSVPATTASASATMTMDALVPCSNRSDDPRLGTCVVGCSTHVGSCSVAPRQDDEATAALQAEKRPRVARVSTAHEWSSKDQSVSGSATTFGRDSHSQHVTVDTFDKDMGMGFTSTSMGSPENTSSGRPGTKETTTGDDHDSVCHSRAKRQGGNEEHKKKGNGKSSVSTKRSRAAAIHNQSERKRRDKINQRMKTLQKLVPNSSKTDKASMLDEVIEYLKQLQAQVHMMSRMNMPPMMLPMSLQQQLQMSMMAPLGMGMGMSMGMGMGMDMNTMGRPNIPGISPVLHPTAFMALNSWDSSGDRLSAPAAAMMPDPMSTFLACQSQPMTMDAYSRMAALYQQLHQPPASNSKS